MDEKRIATIAIVVVVLAAGYAVAGPATNGSFWNTGVANLIPGFGMMGGYGGYGMDDEMMAGYGSYGMGGGMMAGYGSYGMGGGMMSGYGNPGSGNYATDPITIEEATEAVEKYLASTGNTDLELKEVMEFSNNFYAEVEEKSTGMHAFELLVNKYTGAVTPEMGPNTMWNTKYGHMAAGTTTTQEDAVTEEQALSNAQAYLDRVMPGTTVDEYADRFYGYYTIHTLEDGNISGMLSVNSYTGAVWYHNWHGGYVDMLEVE